MFLSDAAPPFFRVLWSGLPKYISKGCANWVTIGKKILEVLKILKDFHGQILKSH
jgi:hypothetical protein